MAHSPIDGGGIVSAHVLEPTPAGAPAERAPPEQPAWRRSGRRALWLFAMGVAGFLLTIGAMVLVKNNIVVAVGFGISTALFVLGFAWSIAAFVRIARSDDRGRVGLGMAVVLLPMLTGAAFSLYGALLTVMATYGFARGRQLRRRGKVLLPPLESGAGWARLDLAVSATPELRVQLAARWRENGRTEHASVAAFARLTLDLIALGAPAELIEAANRDAMDEIRHADLCFSIARALDGRSESPGPFPAAQHAGGLPSSRPLALAKLAVSSLVDGALHEGLSARVIARLVKSCEEPVIRDALRELAADEGRHSAHGWDLVEWCLAEGGAPVAHALRGALRTLPEHVDSDLPADARSGAWEKHGIHGAALEAEEHAKARADVVRRVRTMTGELVAA
jgi:hypothetical protein